MKYFVQSRGECLIYDCLLKKIILNFFLHWCIRLGRRFLCGENDDINEYLPQVDIYLIDGFFMSTSIKMVNSFNTHLLKEKLLKP